MTHATAGHATPRPAQLLTLRCALTFLAESRR